MAIGSRNIPLSHGSHVIGSQVLPTGRVEHESALERDFVTVAGFRDAGVKILAQPVTIHFDDGGRPRRYTPDFRVDWSEGCSELVEVKYRSDLRTNWPRLRPGFAAARLWSRERGMRFRIATEYGIRGAVLDAAKRLLPLRRGPIDLALADRAIALAAAGDYSFDELRRALSGDDMQVVGTIWRLIARGALQADVSARISGETKVWVP